MGTDSKQKLFGSKRREKQFVSGEEKNSDTFPHSIHDSSGFLVKNSRSLASKQSTDATAIIECYSTYLSH